MHHVFLIFTFLSFTLHKKNVKTIHNTLHTSNTFGQYVIQYDRKKTGHIITKQLNNQTLTRPVVYFVSV